MGWIKESFERDEQDPNGQAPSPFYRSYAVQARQVDELIGLVRGVLADGVLCQEEVQFLLKWLETNQHVQNEWPAKAIYPRIAAALSDGILDADEEADIMELLLATIGHKGDPLETAVKSSTALPLTSPPPVVTFTSRSFCFTGKFNSGTRAWCEAQVHNRGGVALSSVNRKLNYLVIGDIGSRDWLHSTFGTKIKKALDQQEKGVDTRIISEQHWYEHLI
jgi:NAD-dependent DNA ligase